MRSGLICNEINYEPNPKDTPTEANEIFKSAENWRDLHGDFYHCGLGATRG